MIFLSTRMTPIFGRHTDTHTHTHTQAHWVTLRPDSVLISAIVVIHRHAVPLYIYIQRWLCHLGMFHPPNQDTLTHSTTCTPSSQALHNSFLHKPTADLWFALTTLSGYHIWELQPTPCGNITDKTCGLELLNPKPWVFPTQKLACHGPDHSRPQTTHPPQWQTNLHATTKGHTADWSRTTHSARKTSSMQ